MTEREALKLALEALTNAYWPTQADLIPAHNIKECAEAITAIKEALAQPEHGWTPELIAGMARLKEAQDKKVAQPSVSVEKKLSSFQEEELMQQQVRDFMRSH